MPAKMTLNQLRPPKSLCNRASAKNMADNASAPDVCPQHAPEKQSECKAAANPPSTHATGESFVDLKKSPAVSPKMAKEIGTQNLAYPTGPASHRKDVERSIAVGFSQPSQFRSIQT